MRCRGGEAFDLLQAFNTGHSGTLSTIHANSAEQALSRFASCVLQSGVDLPYPGRPLRHCGMPAGARAPRAMPQSCRSASRSLCACSDTTPPPIGYALEPSRAIRHADVNVDDESDRESPGW